MENVGVRKKRPVHPQMNSIGTTAKCLTQNQNLKPNDQIGTRAAKAIAHCSPKRHRDRGNTLLDRPL